MKKTLVLALLCLVAMSAFAQDIKFGAGISLDYMPMFQNVTIDAAVTDLDMSMNVLAISAYFDASFVSLAVGYAFSMGGQTANGTSFGVDVDNVTNDDFSMSMMTIALLFKYPFDIGGWYIFPLLGVEYSIMMVYDDGTGNLVGDSGYDDMNDFVLLGGAGAAFMVDKFVISPKVLIVYNLTPYPEADVPSAVDNFSQWGIAVGINIGYMF